MIVDLGDISLIAADDANIPVDIWLQQVDENDDLPHEVDGMKWCLYADNYMPRKGCLSGACSYCVYASTRQELSELIRRHVLPLYEQALSLIGKMADVDRDEPTHLYYWEDTSPAPAETGGSS